MPTQKTEQEIQEEEELQLALALSKSEEETKHKEVVCCCHLDKLFGHSDTVNSEIFTRVLFSRNPHICEVWWK